MSITHLSLFKRSNSIWYLIYIEEGRQRWKSTGCNLKSDALIQLTEFKKLLQSKPKTQTLSKFKEEFLAYAQTNYSRATIDIFLVGLRNLQQISGDCLLTSLTPHHVDKYKAERLKLVSPVSVNVEIRGLRAVFNVALRWRLIESNPFCGMQLIKVNDVPPAYFGKKDFYKLISVIKENWLKDIVIFAVITGMRRGEILNLRWQDVDLQRRVIHVQSNPTFKTKQGKRRSIPLSDIAYQILIKRFGRSTCEYVFSLNNRNILGNFMTKKFKDYVLLVGLDDKLHFHSLRHTFASWLVQDGVSLYEVQKLLGHSNISVTQVYSHLQPETLHATVNKISIPMN